MQGIDFIFSIAILIMAVIIHEVSHGYVAYLLGDPTAKYSDRLNLNPLKHLDPVGSLIVPLFLFLAKAPFLIGWAKPVPYNPYNLKNQKWGPAIVAIAGPASNFLMAGVFGFLSFLIPLSPYNKTALAMKILSGGGLSGGGYFGSLFSIFLLVVLINLVLGVFNLIPIPPLDGSKIVFPLLPFFVQRQISIWGGELRIFFSQYGIFIFLFIVFFGGVVITPIFNVVFYIVLILFRLFTGVGL